MWWKIGLIVAILIVFSVAVVPTKDNPEPIKRGLDLKGGTHLVMRVNVGDAVRLETDQAAEMFKSSSSAAVNFVKMTESGCPLLSPAISRRRNTQLSRRARAERVPWRFSRVKLNCSR